MNTPSQEIIEILDILSTQTEYIIWSGFAQYAHLGLPYSADIDIVVKDIKTKETIEQFLTANGWKEIPNKLSMKELHTFLKNGSTFDIKVSSIPYDLFYTDHVSIEVYGRKLNFISKEGLYVTKLGQMSIDNRSDEKVKRDRDTIQKLRPLLDIEKLRAMIQKLPDSYYRTGLI